MRRNPVIGVLVICSASLDERTFGALKPESRSRSPAAWIAESGPYTVDRGAGSYTVDRGASTTGAACVAP